jgi:UDP-N-acetylglucosamine 4,6-dehydratase/5-epimerase
VVISMPSYLKDKRVLVTGATGSFGKLFIDRLLNQTQVSSVVAFSRDELKQFEMQAEFLSPKLEFVLGDVRDFSRILQVTKDVDVVIHAAAMKQIPASESNPMEAIKTNILGAENIVNAAIANQVKKVVALSTDKAANPANLYGATKLCSDKLMIAGNYLSKSSITSFAVVRYGNVLGSRGSVIPFFQKCAASGKIPITDNRMTRFWLTLNQGVSLVLNAIEGMHGGEIFVPKIPSFKVIDVARIVAPGIPTYEIGIRPGEKLHEVMITEDDSHFTRDFGDYYVILSPQLKDSGLYTKVSSSVREGFTYRSDTNEFWFDDESFITLLGENNIL